MEFPLFETLAIEQGKIRNIERHQQRYERSLQAFYGKQSAVVFGGQFSQCQQNIVPPAQAGPPQNSWRKE